jgi:hypothetical protein
MSPQIPSDLSTFLELFPDWPDHSLSLICRQDLTEGSKWTLQDLGIFQVLRHKVQKEFPLWLQEESDVAALRVSRSPATQDAVTQLNDTRWRNFNRSALLQEAGPFAPFFSLLAGVIEPLSTPNPTWTLRDLAAIDEKRSNWNNYCLLDRSVQI